MIRVAVIFFSVLIWIACSALAHPRRVDTPIDSRPSPIAIDVGDDVSAAVATYTIDHSGSLVEVHSPRTEVPRLKPPTT